MFVVENLSVKHRVIVERLSQHFNARGFRANGKRMLAIDTDYMFRFSKERTATFVNSEEVFIHRLKRLRPNRRIGLVRNFPVIGRFYADFYCIEENMVIEIDGSFHDTDKQKTKDAERDFLMKECGLKLIRIAHPTMQNLDTFYKWAGINQAATILQFEKPSPKTVEVFKKKKEKPKKVFIPETIVRRKKLVFLK